MKEYLQLGAFELAEKVKQKAILPSELVELHIERIESVNRKINAVVEKKYEEARQLARWQDEVLLGKKPDLPAWAEESNDIKAGLNPKGKLFGVPFTVKEMLALNGAKRTAGSIHRRDHRMDFDATVVSRLKSEGAIPLGTTNVPELGFWFECSNPVYGTTNNPYSQARTSGGSSGGEGAIIGAGASPFGVGSDIGGSIRMPAGFCGVAGHKPSNRIVPLTGHFPYYNEQLKSMTDPRYPYTSIGPIARKVSDLRGLLQIIAGPDEVDPEVKTILNLDPLVDMDFSQLKVWICPRPLIHMARETSDEMADVVHQAARYLEQFGAEVKELPSRYFVHAFELWSAALRNTKDQTYGEVLSPEEPIKLGKEFFNLATGKGRYTFPSLVTTYLERFVASGEKQQALLAELNSLRSDFDQLLQKEPHSILLFPLHPRVAPKHGSPLFTPFDFVYTGIFNVLGNPATAVPMGLNSDGLPLSLQVVGAWGKDSFTLQVAESLEAGFGGWVIPNI